MAFKCENILRICQYMNKTKHWHCGMTCNPIGMHYTITLGNLKPINETFCKDLQEAVDYVRLFFKS